MPKGTEFDGVNLSGLWRGQYSYPVSRRPMPFTASLTEADSWLVGATEEVATAGKARGSSITATLQGRRAGRSVTFLKIYDGADAIYDTVHYAGRINDDATEIEGRWTVPGNWSGKFLMIRPAPAFAPLAREVSEKV